MASTAKVLGASGFAGGEVLRLLAGHPGIEVSVAAAGRRAGAAIGDVDPALIGSELRLATPAEAAAEPADVCFSCLPSGELGDADCNAEVVIDLSDEHRAAPGWTYGLTELNRERLRGARRIANPGCYPTAVLLAAVPFARAGVIGSPVIVDAISGVSGAGRAPEDRLLGAVVDGDLTAYGTTRHRHVPEMERALAGFGGLEATVSFTPHLAPVARGLVATVRAPLTRRVDDDAALGILTDAYGGERFVTVVDAWPGSKALRGSNRVALHARVDARAGVLVAAAALDNLGKGAAGQAVQNANLALGLEEDTGLPAVGVWP